MEKLPIYTTEEGLAHPQPRWDVAEERPNKPRNCLLRRILISLALFAGFYLIIKQPYFRSAAPCHSSGRLGYPVGLASQTDADNKEQAHELSSNNLPVAEPHKIPLEAHIMSKCPDAQACLKNLILPTMEQVSDKVDFQLSFIAE